MLSFGTMRRWWPLLAVSAAAIGLAALIGVLRSDVVSFTPGEVVERFLGRIESDGYEKATPLLTDEVGRSVPPEALKRWKRSVEAGLGKIRRVRGETEWISGEEAEATGVLDAGRRERRLRFGLEREDGRWKIARLDEFWSEDSDSSRTGSDLGSIRVREGVRQRPRNASRRSFR